MNPLIWLTVILAALDWFAVGTHRRTLEYLAKPGTILALIGWYWGSLPSVVPWYGYAFLIGLALSLIGDVFLMLPDQFIPGLLAFLFAHITYITAFNATGLPLSVISIASAGVIAVLTISIIRPILRALTEHGREVLTRPIMLYAVILAATLWSTTNTLFQPSWPLVAGLCAGMGGALFYTSDALNAWQRFVTEIRGAHLPVMITYHLAQIALTTGMIIFLSGLKPGS